MSEFDFITQSLVRIEDKLDTELKDHETRISSIEGGTRVLRWAFAAAVTVATMILGVFTAQ